MYVDIGAYGTPLACKQNLTFDIKANSRLVEQWVASVGGSQMLYASCYQTQEEFLKMFNHGHYNQMKQLHDPHERFPRVWDKVYQKN